MKYIKHNGEFFQKITLKELGKKELIELIENAVEVNEKIVEKWINYPWMSGIYTSSNDNIVTYDYGSLSKDNLVTMCSSI